MTTFLSLGLLLATADTSQAVTYREQHHRRYVRAADARRIRHRRHIATAKRVGIGAAGGAAIGALAGGGVGAGIGAIAGAGAGALYDQHQKNHGHN